MDGRSLIAAWYRRARQALCSHRFYFDDLVRISDDLVRCPCFRCEKVCEATHGLALDGRLWGYRPKKDRPPNRSLCYDCGASIIAADDDALICIQCGGRNRRVGHRVGSNPPPPGPLLREGLELRLTKELRPSTRPTGGPPAPQPLQERHETAGDAAAANLKQPGDFSPAAISAAKVQSTPAPLTADVVRKIVREEIERALRPAGNGVGS